MASAWVTEVMFTRRRRGRSVPGVTGDVAAGGITALEISSRSGAVVVWARPVARPEVLHGTAAIQPDGTVRSRGSEPLEIACPEGTDVVIGSRSGRVECHGALGRVAVTGSSGQISIDDAREVEVRTGSGRVAIGRCAGVCRVAVKSGSVQIGSAGAIDVTASSGRLEATAVGDAVVRCGSGRVTVGLDGPGTADVRTMSGSVSLSVPHGVAPDLQLRSRSGRVRTDVDHGRDGRVVIETSSGSIEVARG